MFESTPLGVFWPLALVTHELTTSSHVGRKGMKRHNEIDLRFLPESRTPADPYFNAIWSGVGQKRRKLQNPSYELST